MKTLLQSIGAVLVGLASGGLVVLALTWAATALFFGGDFTAPPTPPYLVTNLSYSAGAAVLAGWLAARLAPERASPGTAPPRRVAHAGAVALVMLALSLGGPDGAAAPGVPGWYGPVLTVFMPLGALLGGWLCVARDRSAAARAVENVRPS